METPAIDVIAAALGDEAIPKLLTSIRQKSDREREVAVMFREGRAVEAVAAMREDGRLHVVAGGEAPTIRRTVELWRQMTDLHAADPEHSLLVMTPTNEQARDVGVAIRADRRQRGEIAAEDGTVLKAMDRNSKERFDLPVAVGDRLRLFHRTRDAEGDRKWLASNGDVVEVVKLQQNGLRVRNAEGNEGLVTWRQMRPWRAPKNDPLQITYGYAVTIDTSQSQTVRDAILAMPEGSRQVSGYKAHTAGSRQEVSYHLVASDGAERKDIVRRQPLGTRDLPGPEDVIRNIAVNFGRFETKRSASDVRLAARGVESEAVIQLQSANAMDQLRSVRAYVLERLTPALERIRQAHQMAVEHVQSLRHERRQDRDLGRSL